jgi:membrane associated rhomboid family serine protease
VQIYGYFVEWYFGKVRYIITMVLSLIVSHLLGCICLTTSVSTTSSSALFAIFSLKLYFLYEYKDYKPLLNRRPFLYALFLLILGVNFIPIFVDNNVDYTAHIAGFITGGLMAIYFHFAKE